MCQAKISIKQFYFQVFQRLRDKGFCERYKKKIIFCIKTAKRSGEGNIKTSEGISATIAWIYFAMTPSRNHPTKTPRCRRMYDWHFNLIHAYSNKKGIESIDQAINCPLLGWNSLHHVFTCKHFTGNDNLWFFFISMDGIVVERRWNCRQKLTNRQTNGDRIARICLSPWVITYQ